MIRLLVKDSIFCVANCEQSIIVVVQHRINQLLKMDSLILYLRMI